MYSMRNNNQILHVDETRCEEIFLHGRQQMLMCDVFAVAKLLVLKQILPIMLKETSPIQYDVIDSVGFKRPYGV